MKLLLVSVVLVGVLGVAGVQAAERHVLFLTDSHGLGPFGDAFERELVADGRFEVETDALGGAAPSWFFHDTLSGCGYAGRAARDNPPPAWRRCQPMRTPQLKSLLRKGELVVVALGANQINDPLGWEYGARMIKRMTAAIAGAGAQCVWIGPPRMRRFPKERLDGFYAVLARALRWKSAPCPLIDSRGLTEYPAKGGDGIHYSFPAGEPIARAWGRVAARKTAKLADPR